MRALMCAAAVETPVMSGSVEGVAIVWMLSAPYPAGMHVRSLDEVDVLLAAAQTESPKPPWLTVYAALK